MATQPTPNLAFQNWFSTTLSQACLATDTTINLNNLPAGTEGYLIIDPNNVSTREVIHYTSLTAGAVVLPGTGDRGLDGTTAQGHAQNTTVVMNITSAHATALQNLWATPNNAVQAPQLATNAITLGLQSFAATSSFTVGNSGFSLLTSLVASVTVPAGGRNLRIEAFIPYIVASAATVNNAALMQIAIFSASTVTAHPLTQGSLQSYSNSSGNSLFTFWEGNVPAGNYVYSVGASASGGGVILDLLSFDGPCLLSIKAV